MMAAMMIPTPCLAGRGLAASRHPFGDARLPVRHGTGAVGLPWRQPRKPNNEVSTFSRDLTA